VVDAFNATALLQEPGRKTGDESCAVTLKFDKRALRKCIRIASDACHAVATTHTTWFSSAAYAAALDVDEAELEVRALRC
jgi:hypothetical protein